MAYESLAETRRGVEDALAKMLQVKKEGPATGGNIAELVTTVSIHFLKLRQLNRVMLQEEDRVKSETEAAKSPLDQTTLQLHNLLYEKNHYLKAIKACKDFKTKYPDIELVPEEEFFTGAPEEMQADADLKSDAHKLMLQRLNYEMLQRKNLCKQRELLEARKKMLQETIANRKKFLSSLPSHLKALKKASLPVQQHLGILHTKRMKQHHLADLLPGPLYILYTQLLAFKEAFAEPVEVEITGNAKEAQALLKQQHSREGAAASVPVEADEENVDEDDDSQRRRKRARRSQASSDMSAFQSHPLSILLQIYDDDEGGNKTSKLLTLKFEYLHKLNVVCVSVENDPITLLANLFPNDTGIDLPNEAAKLSVDNKLSEDITRTSRWFKWAQHLAGLDFLPETSSLSSDNVELLKSSISAGLGVYRQQRRVQTVLQQLRSRKKSQVALKEQLDSLQRLIRPVLRFKKVAWASCTPNCQLSYWKAADSQAEPVVLLLDSEASREDGELPPPALLAPSTSFKDNATSDAGALGRTRSPEGIQSRPHVLDMDLNVSAVELPDEELMDYETEEKVEEAPAVNECRVKPNWKEHGTCHYAAMLRRDDPSTGRVYELEALVKLAVDYPGRPPLFQLRLLSANAGLVRPSVPAGVLDVVEEPLQGEKKVECFNELRAMEAKVNGEVLQLLPKWEEDQVLSHQMALLSYLFDNQVDAELALSTSRTHRGRERRLLSN